MLVITALKSNMAEESSLPLNQAEYSPGSCYGNMKAIAAVAVLIWWIPTKKWALQNSSQQVREQTNLLCNHTLSTSQQELFIVAAPSTTTQRLFLLRGLSSNLAFQGHIIWNALGATAVWYILFFLELTLASLSCHRPIRDYELGQVLRPPDTQTQSSARSALFTSSRGRRQIWQIAWKVLQVSQPHVWQIQSNCKTFV